MEKETTKGNAPKADKALTYEQAMQQLEALAQQMERGEFTIDALAAKLQEAQRLIAFCKQQLQDADTEVQEILNKTAK